jgi:hypothetical protein
MMLLLSRQIQRVSTPLRLYRGESLRERFLVGSARNRKGNFHLESNWRVEYVAFSPIRSPEMT